jgi:large subunit ribosomal protein L22
MEAVAKLKNYPTSPRKMRLLADLVRGKQVDKALAVLEHNPKHPAVPLAKLVKVRCITGRQRMKAKMNLLSL